MPITKTNRPCRDCKSITCTCHDGRPRTVAETIAAWREDYEAGASAETDVPFDLHVRVLGMDEVLSNLEFYGGEV